jgi:hypothetical protein
LQRHFANELKSGRAMLKVKIIGKFYAALDDDAHARSRWATGSGLAG